MLHSIRLTQARRKRFTFIPRFFHNGDEKRSDKGRHRGEPYDRWPRFGTTWRNDTSWGVTFSLWRYGVTFSLWHDILQVFC
jgi:hypothetical protein